MRKIFFLFISIFIFNLPDAFAEIGLKDIETAIIQRNYQQAQQLARKFITLNPPKSDSDEAQYYLGLSLLYLERDTQAREVFEQLIQYKPSDRVRDKAYLGIIDSYILSEEYARALSAAHELLKISSNSDFESLIYLKIARANLKLAEWSEAQKYLKKIISNFPNSLEVDVAKQFLEEEQYFAVQLGAFLKQEKAQALVEELTKRSEYAYIVETTDASGRKFFRVRVGHLSRLQEANQLKKKLSSLGYPTEVYP